MPEADSPAVAASWRALEAMYACLEAGQSFRLEAGAGAGKTYSLIKALQFLIERDHQSLPKRSQQIACITFTNVASSAAGADVRGEPGISVEFSRPVIATAGPVWAFVGP
ncbi:hypothetical protein Rfer_1043 [Rhodoferax ferrireducens T118]|uniref:UvrD-like helicase ATP-binding domain-containing protein n=1 Tax=Albidiferax ferrireducens (strain ATCC BAA-621 / DSM 15236 / T118) TaxID=338969 RepID=Q21ZL8_ALBFT|nr:UvrD-helicase domain-containing protein [Rhodoferax ferrireducens]ABD68785.1 hypothetical protein Rfer_1043 [Rhodoferax ferrireducens T118]